MKRFSFTLITLLFLCGLGYVGYLAMANLKDPKLYVADSKERIGDLHRVATSTEDGDVRSVYEHTPSLEGVVASTSTSTATVASSGASSTNSLPVSSGNSGVGNLSLTDQLEKLVAQKIVLKKGSKGAWVGTVQQFMNIYFKKSLKIDNDFGKTLEADVKKFQTANKISATGQVGTQTAKKMLEIAKTY